MNNLRIRLGRLGFLLAVVLCFGTGPDGLAKAYYAGEEEMIEKAEAIAIVDISRVDKATTSGKPFDYTEIAQATVRQTLKGTLPETVQLYGGEMFICAQVHYGPGRYLVFLRQQDGLWVGTNWHLSVRPIGGAQVEWYVPGERLKMSWQPLTTVLERVKTSAAKVKDR